VINSQNLFINRIFGEDKMVKHVLSAIAVSAGLVMAPVASAAVYFFGDSLSDTGNTSISVRLSTGLSIPGTPLNFPAGTPNPYEPGQYTNSGGGGVWAAQFAAATGQSAAPALLGGTNYAFAGARTYTPNIVRPYSAIDPSGLPGLGDQVAFYTSGITGVRPAGAAPTANDLFVIMMGGNDVNPALVAANTARGIAIAGGSTEAQANLIAQNIVGSAITDGLANIRASVATLVGRGASHFLIANMPDVAATPNVRDGFGGAFVAPVQDFTNAWNGGFNQSIAGLRAALPSVDIDVLDLYGLATKPASFYTQLGFTNTTDFCFREASLVANCANWFYSDNFHPTTGAHAVIAREALAAVPVPGALLLVLAGLAGLVGVRRKA
jgi:outer membrane lipase/esterase